MVESPVAGNVVFLSRFISRTFLEWEDQVKLSYEYDNRICSIHRHVAQHQPIHCPVIKNDDVRKCQIFATSSRPLILALPDLTYPVDGCGFIANRANKRKTQITVDGKTAEGHFGFWLSQHRR